MGEYSVLAGFFLIFLWGWRRVYAHVMRKNARPLVAHMLGLLLALFPARFFVYAAFAIAPQEGAEPVSDTKTFLLCALFAVSVAGLYFLTKKRFSKMPASLERAESNLAGEMDRDGS